MLLAVTSVIVLFILTLIMGTLYKKVGPSEALIVSGGSLEPKTIIGGGTVVLPLLQTARVLSLELMSIDVKSTSPYASLDGSQLIVDAVVEARLKSDSRGILEAARNFAAKDIREVRSIIYDAGKDCMRRCVANQKKDLILEDYDVLAQEVKGYLSQDLDSLGVDVRTVRVREVRETRSSLSTQQGLPAIATDESNGNSRSLTNLIGKIGVVSKSISSNKYGEVTISIDNGVNRIAIKARSLHLGGTLDINSAVVIASTDETGACVEPWSTTHANLPASLLC